MDGQTIQQMMSLSRLNTEDPEKMAASLDKMLHFVSLLETVDTKGVEPLACVAEGLEFLRVDLVCDGGCPEAILQNAPQKDMDMFVVPKVIE